MQKIVIINLDYLCIFRNMLKMRFNITENSMRLLLI